MGGRRARHATRCVHAVPHAQPDARAPGLALLVLGGTPVCGAPARTGQPDLRPHASPCSRTPPRHSAWSCLQLRLLHTRPPALWKAPRLRAPRKRAPRTRAPRTRAPRTRAPAPVRIVVTRAHSSSFVNASHRRRRRRACDYPRTPTLAPSACGGVGDCVAGTPACCSCPSPTTRACDAVGSAVVHARLPWPHWPATECPLTPTTHSAPLPVHLAPFTRTRAPPMPMPRRLRCRPLTRCCAFSTPVRRRCSRHHGRHGHGHGRQHRGELRLWRGRRSVVPPSLLPIHTAHALAIAVNHPPASTSLTGPFTHASSRAVLATRAARQRHAPSHGVAHSRLARCRGALSRSHHVLGVALPRNGHTHHLLSTPPILRHQSDPVGRGPAFP